MLTPRHHHATALLPNGRVIVAGGFQCNVYSLKSAETFDPSNGVWSRAASLSVPRNAPMAARVGDGRVVVAGGGRASTEIYNAATDEWSVSGRTVVPVANPISATMGDGRVLVVEVSSSTATSQI